jgi:hypothetical protein
VPDRAGNQVPNPILSPLRAGDPGRLMLLGIVGVPWQQLAANPMDLTLGLKSSAQLDQVDPQGHDRWEVMLGDPARFVAPLDPHMIESNAPRSGTDPTTGIMLAPPTAPSGTDAINGHEYTPGTSGGVQVAPNDLEYACIFPLSAPVDCSAPGAAPGCVCLDPLNDNPLCEANPAQGGNRTLQVATQTYPGLRQLALLRSLRDQGVAGSACVAQRAQPDLADHGFRPSVRALRDRVMGRLAPAP